MKSSRIEFIVGLFVLIGIVAIVYLAVRIGGGRVVGAQHYTLKAEFSSVSGLNIGSTVEVAGVPVGAVSDIYLNMEYLTAVVEMKIDKRYTFDDDTIASVKSTGLIGSKFLSLSPGGSGMALEPGATIFDTESAVDLEGLISQFAFGTVDQED